MTTPLLDLIGITLLIILLIPLFIFIYWNWQYRHATNGLKIVRDTIQHWVTCLFLLVLYTTIRRVAAAIGWYIPDLISQLVGTVLFAYLIFRTWTAMVVFKRIRDAEVHK